MIHALTIHWPFLWKFVDDTTASEIFHKGDVSNAQSITDQVILWPQENRMHLFYLFITYFYCFGATEGSEQQHNQDFKEIYKGATNSRIHHFLPQCIAFNQSALRYEQLK